MSGKEFESTIKEMLVEELAILDGDEDLEVHHGRKYVGKASGHEHEIDLSFELEAFGSTILVLIECKEYSRRVSIDDVMEFNSRILDIGAHKGIMVTTQGYTRSAIKFARSRGIALIVVAQGKRLTIMRSGSGPPDIVVPSLRHSVFRCSVERTEGGVRLVFRPFVENHPVLTGSYVVADLGGPPVFRVASPGGNWMSFGEISIYPTRSFCLSDIAKWIRRSAARRWNHLLPFLSRWATCAVSLGCGLLVLMIVGLLLFFLVRWVFGFAA